jgi:hypothetical protein
MTISEKKLIDLLFGVKNFKEKCIKIHAPIAIPSVVYTKFDELILELTKWGIECVEEERKKGGESK